MTTKHQQLLRLASALVLSLVLAAALLVVVGSALALPRVDSLLRVTSASDANRASKWPSLSEDGTVVAFRSDSDLLNEGRPDSAAEIWLYDTATMTFTRVTSASHAYRGSYVPSLNGDGTAVAFESDSDFLNEGIADGQYEIWLYDTATLTFTRVTTASHSDRDSNDPSLSGDGTVVAFESDSDLLNEGRLDNQWEIWLYDTETLTYTRVTSASHANRDSYDPSLSGDGTAVAFRSDSDFVNEGIADEQSEIWLYDTSTLTYTRVTTASHANRDSWYPSLNGDGTAVAFYSDSDLLNESRQDNVDEIWLYDTATLTYTRVTTASHANRDSYDPSLNGDGTVVAFRSDSDLLNEGIAEEQDEIWLWEEFEYIYLPLALRQYP